MKQSIAMRVICGLCLFVAVAILLNACSSGEHKNGTVITALSYKTCKPANSSECCIGTVDRCHKTYGDDVAEYLGFQAKSNGACTNGGSGYYQCTTFVQNFYERRLHLVLGSLGNGGDYIDSVKNASYYDKEVFSFEPGAHEPPRVTDILSFGEDIRSCELKNDDGTCARYTEWRRGYGHVVIVSGIKKVSGKTQLEIIEQNVVPTVCNVNPLPSYGRRLKVDADTYYVHGFNNEQTSTTKWFYNGFIRHNLAGIYGDYGWHRDDTSQAFRSAYLRYFGCICG